MLAIAHYDARHYIIPDILSLPAIPAGIAATYYVNLLGYDLKFPIGDAQGAAIASLWASAVTGLALLALRQAYLLLRGRDGLGLGDVKLGFACGAWVGYPGTAYVLLLAAISAIIFITLANRHALQELKSTTPIAFGSFFAPAIWLVWFVQLTGIGLLPGLL